MASNTNLSVARSVKGQCFQNHRLKVLTHIGLLFQFKWHYTSQINRPSGMATFANYPSTHTMKSC